MAQSQLVPPSRSFDSLVSSLSLDERREMLDRINRLPQSEPPGEVIEGEQETPDVSQEYNRLSLLQKLLISISALFTGRRREDVIESRLLRSLTRRVDRLSPHILQAESGRLGTEVYRRLHELSELASQASDYLASAQGNRRGRFFAVLLASIDPSVLQWIEESANPERIAGRVKGITNRELYRRMEESLEHGFDRLSVPTRSTMYLNARWVDNAFRLSAYPFSKVLSEFTQAGESGERSCDFYAVHAPLADLDEILTAIGERYSQHLVSALSLNYFRSSLDDPDPDTLQRVEASAGELRLVLERLGAFRRSFPLTAVIRVLAGNLHYRPADPGGGEDWLAQLRAYYQERLDSRFEAFTENRLREELARSFSETVAAPIDEPLANYGASKRWGGRFRDTLRFLRSFHRRAFLKSARSPLRVLLIEGIFYKDQNRQEFTEALDMLGDIEGRMRSFEARLAETGNLGGGMQAAEEEGAVERQEALSAEADRLAQNIAVESIGAIRIVCNVVYGVLFGEPGGRYDTLSNRNEIGGRGNAELLQRLESAHELLKACLDVISRTYDLENLGKR